MRRWVLIVCAAFTGIALVSLTGVSAGAQSAEQYESSDGSEATSIESVAAPTEAPPTPSGGTISQGSVVEDDSSVEVREARADLAEEDRLPAYSRVVDDTTKGRFVAPGWKKRSGSKWSHGKSYVSAGSRAKAARFKVKIPSNNDYSVYAWWPKAAANSAKTRFGVGAASGTKWGAVDQRTEGGMWIKLGTYAMKKGERFVQVAARPASKGRVVADAVAVVRGETLMPPEKKTVNPGAPTGRATTDSGARRGSGYAVVRQARKHIGDRYGYGTCTTTVKSCTCLTKMAVAYFGHTMSMDEAAQWRYEGSVRVTYSKLQPGDEVFFKENGRSGPITHVGIYSGNGRIVHASSYFGKVVEKEMKYIDGYAGAKRFKFR